MSDATTTPEPPDDKDAVAESEPVAGGGSEEPAAEPAGASEAPPVAEAPAPAHPAAARRPRDPALARAFRSKRPVQGRIVGVIKGGYEVRIGRSRAFCPHSQLDLHRVDDPEAHVGETHFFAITQFRRGGEDIVVSRRALLEAERADEAAAVRATLIEGSVMLGHVSGVADFGAFVDLGAGVQGLVHVSELSHTRIARVSDAVKVGSPVHVKILKIQDEGRRISLSMRQAIPDPWEAAERSLEAGRTYPGRVLRLADFGAFVEMMPGVEALAPAREFPPSTGGWSEGLEPGAERSWLVLAIDRKQRRLTVVPWEAGEPAPPEPEVGATLTGRVQRIERFGVFVWLGPGRVGLMPTSWSGVPQGTRLDSRFKIGDAAEVMLVDRSDDGRRLRLAAPGVDPVEVDARRDAVHAARGSRGTARSRPRPRDERADTAVSEGTGTFGTSLGDALKAALEHPERG